MRMYFHWIDEFSRNTMDLTLFVAFFVCCSAFDSKHSEFTAHSIDFSRLPYPKVFAKLNKLMEHFKWDSFALIICVACCPSPFFLFFCNDTIANPKQISPNFSLFFACRWKNDAQFHRTYHLRWTKSWYTMITEQLSEYLVGIWRRNKPKLRFKTISSHFFYFC